MPSATGRPAVTAKVDPDSGGLTEIWKPLDIGPTRVKNRIMMSPHRQAFRGRQRTE